MLTWEGIETVMSPVVATTDRASYVPGQQHLMSLTHWPYHRLVRTSVLDVGFEKAESLSQPYLPGRQTLQKEEFWPPPSIASVWRFLHWLSSFGCCIQDFRWVSEGFLSAVHGSLLLCWLPYSTKMSHTHLSLQQSLHPGSGLPSDHLPTLQMWSTLTWPHPAKVSQQKRQVQGLALSRSTVSFIIFPFLLALSFPASFLLQIPLLEICNSTIKLRLLNATTP